jgi:hypothetical protein
LPIADSADYDGGVPIIIPALNSRSLPVLKKIGLTVLLAALSGVASAGESCKVEYFLWFPIEVCTPTGGDHGAKSTAVAPEIDSASAMSGLALALGGLAVLRARRFKNPIA